MITLGEALIVSSFVLNVYFGLYIFNKKFRKWVISTLKEDE